MRIKMNLIWGKRIEVEFLRDKGNSSIAGNLIKQGATMFYDGRIVRFTQNHLVPWKEGYFYLEAERMRLIPYWGMTIGFYIWGFIRKNKRSTSMEAIENEIQAEEILDGLTAPQIRSKKAELRYRIKNALHMYAPEELVKLAEKHKLTPKRKRVDGTKEAVPGVLIADLLVLRLIIDGVEGDKTAIKLLFEHGFGRPDTNVNFSLSDEQDDVEDIPIPTEDKIAYLRQFRNKSIEAEIVEDT
jgi:hypothetical protein